MFQVSIYYNFAKNPSSFNAANFIFCWRFCASAFWILNNSHLKLQPSSRTQCAPSQRKYLFILRSNQVNQASSLARIWHGCFDIGNWSKRVTEYKLRYTISKISHSVIISKGWQPCRFKTSSVLVSKKCLNRRIKYFSCCEYLITFYRSEEIIVIVTCGYVNISSLYSFDGKCQMIFYAVRLKKRTLYKEKSNFSIV